MDPDQEIEDYNENADDAVEASEHVEAGGTGDAGDAGGNGDAGGTGDAGDTGGNGEDGEDGESGDDDSQLETFEDEDIRDAFVIANAGWMQLGRRGLLSPTAQ